MNERFAATIARHEEEVASLCTAVEVVKVLSHLRVLQVDFTDATGMQDAVARPGLLGTVRNKVAQVYKGVGGYLPQSPAVNQAEARVAVVFLVS